MKTLFMLPLLLVSYTPQAEPNYDQLALKIRATLEKMVEADTTNPPGNEALVVEIAKRRLDAAGIPYEITEFLPGRQNIVARLKGSGAERPILLISHTDVVSTENQNWTVPPHKLTEMDGYLYGRGVMDDLGQGAINLEVLIYLKESGIPLRRDIIVALTGDEETGGLGVPYLLENRFDSIDAAFAINEGGGVTLDEAGNAQFNSLQVAEKIYQDFQITATGTPGHSSVPLKDNAIYRLSQALARLEGYQRPARLMEATRAYYKALSGLEKDAVRAQAMKDLAEAQGELPKEALAILESNPVDAATLRTTCVATMIEGGSSPNSLPAQAMANINCRMLPDESMEDLAADLKNVIADEQIEIKGLYNYKPAPPSPHEGEGAMAIEKVTQMMFPNLVTIPTMSNFSTDSIFLRGYGIPSYGFSPFPLTDRDYQRMHGADERIPVGSLKTGAKYTYLLLLELAAEK
jgi:acetylornithine deacetylase/succinyl-diaminopimelate desuccinylase-like protein